MRPARQPLLRAIRALSALSLTLAPLTPAVAAPLEPFGVWATPEQLTTDCDAAISEAGAARDQLKGIARADLTLSRALKGYNKVSERLDRPYGLSGLIFNVHPDEPMRTAAQACEQRLSKFTTDLGLDRALFEVFSAVSPDDLKVSDPDSQRLYALIMRDFKRSGVHLSDEARARLAQINEELTQLSQDYLKNINADTKRLSIDEPARLKGLPEDFVKAKQEEAAARAKEGGDARVQISTDYPDFFPFEQYAEDRALRAELYRLFLSRGMPQNAELLSRVLKLRHEYANLLGASTWAEYNAGDKMVGDAQTIARFLEQITAITRPITQRELGQLLARIQRDDPKAASVEVWDRFYYTGKLREEERSFDAKSVRPYFGYASVKDGVFALYGELFGLTFERDAAQATWAEGVEAYRLVRDGRVIGRFFLDMHPRPNKYKHAAMFPVQTGLKGGALPVASLVCNFPQPRAAAEGKAADPGLMEHGEVTTFFHEFGHLIHHLLAQESPWVRLSGINVEWDFVEAPSQILEEWAWEHSVLSRFARHAETGEVIPKDLVDRMRAAEEFGKGVAVMRQIFYASYSFFLHHQDPSSLKLEEFSQEMYKKYSPYPAVAGGAEYANFGHLMGYSSMYYTYQWSLVIAKDLFTRFEQEGLLNPAAARAYAKEILQRGGAAPAAELVRGFLGREYNMDAYKRWLERGQ